MHGMGRTAGIIYNDAHRGVGAEVVDIPFRAVGVGVISELRQQQDRLVVVGTERYCVHREDAVATCVLAESNSDRLCGWGRRIRRYWEPGLGFRERVLHIF